MRFLLDQDVYATTARLLSGLGHDVTLLAQIGLAQAEDEDLLRTAQNQSRLLVTRDRDFGKLVFVNALGCGVLYLRVMPSTQSSVHQELERVLNIYSEEELRQAFVVVEAGGPRVRRGADKQHKLLMTDVDLGKREVEVNETFRKRFR